jgi:membrane-bound acyltransferase YfiQ involved in biofilm formation
MSMVSILAVIAGISFLVFMMLPTFKVKPSSKRSWIFPAALSMLFLIFSLLVVLSEGPLGFWSEHTLNMWGN